MFPHWFQLRHFLALFFPLLLTQMGPGRDVRLQFYLQRSGRDD